MKDIFSETLQQYSETEETKKQDRRLLLDSKTPEMLA